MYKSINELDIKIEEILGESFFKNCFYIEAGANDGINQSNTYFIEHKYNSKGMLIEAVPLIYNKLINNRNQNNIFENCALVSYNYTDTYCDIAYCNLMSTNLSDKDDDLIRSKEEHIRLGKEYVKDDNYGKIFKVQSKTLQSLLDKHNIINVDLFSLDVEGNEFSVLNGIDYDKVNIKVILVESRNVTRVQTLFESKNYRLYSKLTEHDYLFIKKNDI